MKILIIGGSGFLGSHVVDELISQGHSIRVLDLKPPKSTSNRCEAMIGDFLDRNLLKQAMVNIDYVYHFAGIADLNKALNEPIETARLNILGTVHVLDCCVQNNIKRFIYSSSLYVYSRSGGFYRCSKQAAEHYIEEYSQSYGLDFTILRYGSLYGPGSDETNGLYRIVKKAVTEGCIKYSGDAESMREYIHVVDAAKASVEILSEDFINQSIILTGQEPMKVSDVLKMLSEIMNLNSEIIFDESLDRGHYVRTPYAFQPKLAKKYIPSMHVDLGQGLLELIHLIHDEDAAK